MRQDRLLLVVDYWCASTTVTRSHVVGRRARGHALAQHRCGTHMHHFLVHIYRYSGTRDDGNETCTRAYSIQYRRLTSALAQHLFGYIHASFCGTYVSLWRDGRLAPALRRQQRETHRHVSDQHRLITNTPAQRYMYVLFGGIYVSR